MIVVVVVPFLNYNKREKVLKDIIYLRIFLDSEQVKIICLKKGKF